MVKKILEGDFDEVGVPEIEKLFLSVSENLQNSRNKILDDIKSVLGNIQGLQYHFFYNSKNGIGDAFYQTQQNSLHLLILVSSHSVCCQEKITELLNYFNNFSDNQSFYIVLINLLKYLVGLIEILDQTTLANNFYY